MVTADEEIQAKEFLKRAEIKTMKKDLSPLKKHFQEAGWV